MPVETPLVSIGILSYNQPEDIRRAIESVLAQTYTNLEILISDNGSTTLESARVIMEYASRDARFRPFLHKVNRGPNFNMQFLVEQATGKYFCWLAGDDAFSSNFIADCVDVLETDENLVLASNMPVITGENKPVPLKYVPDTRGINNLEKYELVLDHIFSDINLFYYSVIRLDTLKKCQLHYKKLFGSDVLLMLELLAYGDFAINKDKPGYLYTIHEGQASGSPARYKKVALVNNPGFIETRLFFSAYIGYMIDLVWSRQDLKKSVRKKIIQKIISLFFRSKRYHMIKYDLGINPLIQFLKKARIK